MLKCDGNGKIAVTDMIDAINSKQDNLKNADIKQKYEANPDTNEFSDAEQDKLAKALTQTNIKAPLVLRGDVYSALMLRNKLDAHTSFYETNGVAKGTGGARFGRLAGHSTNNYMENRFGANISQCASAFVINSTSSPFEENKQQHIYPTYNWRYQGKANIATHNVYNPIQGTDLHMLASKITPNGKSTVPTFRLIKSMPHLDAPGSNNISSGYVSYARVLRNGKPENEFVGGISMFTWGADWDKKDSARTSKDSRGRLQIGVRGGTDIMLGAFADGSCEFRPLKDNMVDLGGRHHKFRNVYCHSVVTPSDDQATQDKRALTDPEYAVAASLINLWKAFKYKTDAAIEAAGGEKAKLYFGVVAEDIRATFAAGGLDVLDYGILTDNFPVHTSTGTFTQDESGFDTAEVVVPEQDILGSETIDPATLIGVNAPATVEASYTIPAESGQVKVETVPTPMINTRYNIDYTALTQFVLVAVFKGMQDTGGANLFAKSFASKP